MDSILAMRQRMAPHYKAKYAQLKTAGPILSMLGRGVSGATRSLGRLSGISNMARRGHVGRLLGDQAPTIDALFEAVSREGQGMARGLDTPLFGTQAGRRAARFQHLTDPGRESAFRNLFIDAAGNQRQLQVGNRTVTQDEFIDQINRLRRISDNVPRDARGRTQTMAQYAAGAKPRWYDYAGGAGLLGAGAYGVGALNDQAARLEMPSLFTDSDRQRRGDRDFVESGVDSIAGLLQNISPGLADWMRQNPYASAGIGAGGSALLALLAYMLMNRQRSQSAY